MSCLAYCASKSAVCNEARLKQVDDPDAFNTVIHGSMQNEDGLCSLDAGGASNNYSPAKNQVGICWYGYFGSTTCAASNPSYQRFCACDCPAGRFWNTTSESCVPCAAGTATNGLVGFNTPAVCQTCHSGRNSFQGSATCVSGDCSTTGQCCSSLKTCL